MGWYDGRTWTQGEIVSAPQLAQQMRDRLNEALTAKAQASGDLFAATAANTPSRIAASSGAEGATFRMNDAGTAPAWRTPGVWTPIYGPADTAGITSMVTLSSGPIVRARQTSGGEVLVQKITDPTDPSQWSTWTTRKAAGTTHTASGCALASDTGSDSLRLFYVDAADGRTIRCSTSTDGTTWAEELVYAEASPYLIRGLAADMAGGDNHLIYALDLVAADPDEVLVSLERVAGVWTNRVQQAIARYTTAGLEVAKDTATGVIHVVVAEGTSTGARQIAYQEFAAGTNTWSATRGTLVSTTSGTYTRPRIRLANADFDQHAYLYVHELSGVYTPKLTLAPSATRYSGLTTISWGAPAQYGFDLVRTSSGWYAASSQRAYRALLADGPTVALEEDYRLPWLIPIDPIDLATGHTNWETRSAVDGPYTSLRESTGAINAEVYWDVPLSAGSWSLGLVYKRAADAGIITAQLDGVSLGTVDGYASSTSLGATTTITFSVTATGLKRLKLLMATKNASASSYKGYVHHLSLMRTG